MEPHKREERSKDDALDDEDELLEDGYLDDEDEWEEEEEDPIEARVNYILAGI